jgi:site-specific DNA-methyltransferase (cytosine-N4-specific)
VAPHPARFPIALPRFFINFLTVRGDSVLDPFAGSNVTGEAAEELGRRWFAFELRKDYLQASRFRFERPSFGRRRQHPAGAGDAEDCPLFRSQAGL